VSEYTGFPEMLDGRVKTLHPKVHGGILARRDVAEHRQALARHDISPIDLVAVNLYPFRETVADSKCTLDQAVEQIDIGGPAMIRSAAKNWRDVGVVVDVADYGTLIAELEGSNGLLSDATRFALAAKAFAHTADYDGAIANWLTTRGIEESSPAFPLHYTLQVQKVQELRYGENPHQQAAFYRDRDPPPGALANYRQVQGKALSYNNLTDADAAWECVKSLSGFANRAGCAIVKHANPCGAALAATALEAYRKALATDPVSAFGGIIAFNRPVDTDVIEAVAEQFVEVLIAPAFTEQALVSIRGKPNVRVLDVSLPPMRGSQTSWDLKRIGGGLLLQTSDSREIAAGELRTVTRNVPTAAQLDDLLFAWRVAKFVKSNAIVHAGAGQTLGIGAGQMSRVDSARIAALKAQAAGLSLAGSVVASDAFFPLRDGVDVVADHGAVAIVQPGGSVRDDEVIAAANERGIAMVFTGVRHFRH
jgi:phosphoribosylaminoimidazolecarboxamide formyltransferase / IMP cyclohydrolase